MSTKLDIYFSIQYDTKDQAQIIFASLLPEIQEQRFERSKATVKLNGQKIVINVTAQDINAAKATISSILRWISTTTKAVMTLSKQTFN